VRIQTGTAQNMGVYSDRALRSRAMGSAGLKREWEALESICSGGYFWGGGGTGLKAQMEKKKKKTLLTRIAKAGRTSTTSEGGKRIKKGRS